MIEIERERKKERERERERERETETETETETEKQTDRQTDIERQRGRKGERERLRERKRGINSINLCLVLKLSVSKVMGIIITLFYYKCQDLQYLPRHYRNLVRRRKTWMLAPLDFLQERTSNC